MDGPGHDLLAGTALALDEDRRLGGGHGADAAEDLLHRLALADEIGKRVFVEELGLEGFDLAAVADDADAAEDVAVAVPQKIRGEKGREAPAVLGDEVGDAVLYRLLILEGPFQRTVGIADAGAQDLAAGEAEDFLFGKTGHLFGAAGEAGDAHVEVDGVDAVGDGVDDGPRALHFLGQQRLLLLQPVGQVLDQRGVAEAFHDGDDLAVFVSQGDDVETQGGAGAVAAAFEAEGLASLFRFDDLVKGTLVGAQGKSADLPAGAADGLLFAEA
jgi:hypothetical protein